MEALFGFGAATIFDGSIFDARAERYGCDIALKNKQLSNMHAHINEILTIDNQLCVMGIACLLSL